MITEAQLEYKINLFAEYMSEMSGEVVSENNMSDADADEISSILLDYFIENYHQPSLKEAAFNCITGIDPNQELYEDIAELFLDESIGGFISGAAHFIGNASAKRNDRKAANATNKAQNKFSNADSKARSTASNGLVKAYRTGRAAKLGNKLANAQRKSSDANSALRDRMQRTDAMKQKIDNKISSVKNSITNAPKKAAHALGSFVGRFA